MNDEIERLGREVYEKADRSPWAPPRYGAIELAALLYGPDIIEESAWAQTESETGRLRDQAIIVVRKGMSPPRTNFAIARMIARIELKLVDLHSREAEDELAAYLVAPRESFRAQLHQVGIDLPRLARPFAITETCAALRVVECTNEEGLVVTPERVYHPRGSLRWVGDVDARRLAKGSPSRLRKVPIADEPGRVALYKKTA